MAGKDRDFVDGVLGQLRYMEERAWTTLNSFLVANAFNMVAWATIYDPKGHTGNASAEFHGVDFVMLTLSLLGFFMSLQWALAGARNWRYVQCGVREIASVRKVAPGVSPVGDFIDTARRGVQGINGDAIGISYHTFMMWGVPLLCSVPYALMTEVVLRPRSPEWAFVAVGVEMSGVLFAGIGSWLYSYGDLKPKED